MRTKSRRKILYCGNNKLDGDLKSGKKIRGNRYNCMKVGINKGLNMEYDPKYNQPYEAIDTTRIYCGLQKLPNDYDRYGSVTECLQKGIGVGKRIKASKSKKRKRRSRRRRSRRSPK